MRMLRPLLTVRICGVRADRIGHFVADIAEHLGREKLKPHRTYNFYYLKGPISNIQWECMAKRSPLNMTRDWLRYLDDWNRFIPGGGSHTMNSSLTESRDIEGLFRRFDCSIPFLPSETTMGEEWLESKGWTRGEPFVVLLVRDSEYLKQIHSSYDWSYHSYRDSDIRTYLTAMEWLASQGVWVLRMGKSMSNPIQSNSNRIIDYSFNSEKSDLLDIWLFANCTGAISTASGLDEIGSVYRKPLLYLNASPLLYFRSGDQIIWVPKNLEWIATGKTLTLNEYLQNSYLNTADYISAGIRIIDLEEIEILAATQEFWQRISGSWQEQTDEKALQEASWDHFKHVPNYSEFIGWKNSESRIGYAWLSSMDDTFLKA